MNCAQILSEIVPDALISLLLLPVGELECFIIECLVNFWCTDEDAEKEENHDCWFRIIRAYQSHDALMELGEENVAKWFGVGGSGSGTDGCADRYPVSVQT